MQNYLHKSDLKVNFHFPQPQIFSQKKPVILVVSRPGSVLKEVIFWSVGTCWIADNFENYSPDNNILKKIQNIKTNLKLRTTERIIS